MELSRPEKKWLFRQMPGGVTDGQVKEISRQQGISAAIVRILVHRGIFSPESISSFLNPTLHQLPRPNLMKGMDAAVVILQDALHQKKPVTVFGDFDADGVTSTAVLSLFFNEIGLRLQTYIPDRMTEGYGLNSEAVKKIFAANLQQWGEPGVLLTADCGISDADVVGEAKKLGFTVIITDHHKPPENLPGADAILNPLQSGCLFPCKNLAGVGVAFYLLMGLRSELVAREHWSPDRIPNLKSYMDLVAIGTVADQVAVTGCNRIIVRSGLEVLNQANRIGLQKLLETARSSGSGITVEDIAFRMAPRINAVGRMGSAHKAVKLMTTDLPHEAQRFAEELDEANNARKNIESIIFSEAETMVGREDLDNSRALVLYKNDWHQGVLGIVANRLCEHFHRPVIMLTDCAGRDADTSMKLVKGSGRSVEGVDIHEAVSACREIVQRFGGHAGAVGLTLAAESLALFRRKFDAAVGEQIGVSPLIPSLFIDMETSLVDLADQGFLAAYGSLAPFGTGNPEPVFCLKGQKLSNPRLVGTNHLRFTLLADGRTINGIGFGFGSLAAVALNNSMDLAFTLRLNSYMGQEKWELNLVDLRPATA